jgi:hypothetical protein
VEAPGAGAQTVCGAPIETAAAARANESLSESVRVSTCQELNCAG